jgi:hypothetical protein
MTLLGAAQSLGIIEVAGVSWINIYSFQKGHVAEFTMALLLPFQDPQLSAALSTGQVGFWPDQKRVLDRHIPLKIQIQELHRSGVLGNLAVVELTGAHAKPQLRWIVETRAGTREERMSWLRSVIEIEGRKPLA